MCILKAGLRTPLVTTSSFPKPPAPPQCGAGLFAKKLTRKRKTHAPMACAGSHKVAGLHFGMAIARIV